MLPVVPIAAALALAFLASRKPSKPSKNPPKDGPTDKGPPSTGTVSGPPPGQGTVAPLDPPGKGDTTTLSDGSSAPNDFMMNNGVVNGAGFRATFISEVWQPAAAVKLSDLTQDDIADAFAFLSGGSQMGTAGKFGRRDDLGQLYRAAVAGIQAQQAGQGTASVVGAIESIIPIVGGALGAANSAAQNAIAGSIATQAQDMGRLVATVVSPQTLDSSPIARAIFAPSCQVTYPALKGEGEDPLSRNDMQSPTALQGVPGYDGYGWEGHRWVHTRLLTRTPYGWMFPWLCNWFDGLPNNLQGSGQTIVPVALRRQRRARLFRAIDTLIAKRNARMGYLPKPSMFLGKPVGDADQPGAAGGWYYKDDIFGDLYAACLPPSNVGEIGSTTDLRNAINGFDARYFAQWMNGPTDFVKDPDGNWRGIHGEYQSFVPTRDYAKKLWAAKNSVGPVTPVTPVQPGVIEGSDPNPLATANDPKGLVAGYIQQHGDEPPLELAQQWLAAGDITQAMFDEVKAIWDRRAQDAAAAQATAQRQAAQLAAQRAAAQAAAQAAINNRPGGTVGPPPNQPPQQGPFGGPVKGFGTGKVTDSGTDDNGPPVKGFGSNPVQTLVQKSIAGHRKL